MSDSDAKGLYTSMLDKTDLAPQPVKTDEGPNPNWRWFWLGLFLASVPLLIPYFTGTKKVFGDPFFSVYTKYMMWLPMKDDKQP